MNIETIDTGKMFPLRIIQKEELNLEKPFTLADFLQFYQVFEENINAMNYEVSELKKNNKLLKLQSEAINHSLELQDKIYGNLGELLERDYKNAFVAITYDGKILASSEDNVKLLGKLRELNYPSSQIFIRKVGSKAVAGWRFKA